MNKEELIKRFAEKEGITKKEASKLVDSFLEEVKQGLLDVGQVKLGALGKVRVVQRKSRVIVPVDAPDTFRVIPEKRSVKLDMHTQLRSALNPV